MQYSLLNYTETRLYFDSDLEFTCKIHQGHVHLDISFSCKFRHCVQCLHGHGRVPFRLIRSREAIDECSPLQDLHCYASASVTTVSSCGHCSKTVDCSRSITEMDHNERLMISGSMIKSPECRFSVSALVSCSLALICINRETQVFQIEDRMTL